VQVAAVAPRESSAANSGAKRRFEFTEGSSGKFWEIEHSGSEVTTWWGKIGTNGQSKTKSFGSEAAASKEADALVREKSTKGYHEQ
jgi:predicted DNA-binding WGR domain protein